MMKRLVVLIAATGLATSRWAAAQTSLDVLQDDLKAAKQQHDDASSQELTTFLGTLQQAAQSPSVALDLYQKAGGSMPDAAPVQKHYEYETPTEKAAREAIDNQNYQVIAVVLQVHCGLMRNAAQLMLYPDKPETKQEWLDFLKTTGPIYPQLAGKRAIKNVAMRDSVISKYLGFHGWGDNEQGNLTLSDLPKLYHDLILEPSRKAPSQETLDDWDTYTAMVQADEPDQDKWNQEIAPKLAFDRAADDFSIQPTMDKLAALDAIIKANPTSDHLDEWIGRMQTMINAYRQAGSAPSTLPGATPGTTSSEVAGTSPVATPGATSSQSAGVTPTATPGAAPVTPDGETPVATPGTASSEAAGTTLTATPGATPVTPGAPMPAATPSAPAADTGAPTPAATPGTVPAGGGAPVPTATPGTVPAGGGAPMPTATPGTVPAGGGAPTPTATPGTPSSGQ